MDICLCNRNHEISLFSSFICYFRYYRQGALGARGPGQGGLDKGAWVRGAGQGGLGKEAWVRGMDKGAWARGPGQGGLDKGAWIRGPGQRQGT